MPYHHGEVSAVYVPISNVVQHSLSAASGPSTQWHELPTLGTTCSVKVLICLNADALVTTNLLPIQHKGAVPLPLLHFPDDFRPILLDLTVTNRAAGKTVLNQPAPFTYTGQTSPSTIIVTAMSPPKRTGLDDPRVTICTDRGDSYRNKRYYRKEDPNSWPPALQHGVSLAQVVEQVVGVLREHSVYPDPSNNKFFIPYGKLCEALNPNQILAIVSLLDCTSQLSPAEKTVLRDRICFGDQPSWRLLAVLLLCGRHEVLIQFIEDKVSDRCLPIGKEGCAVPGHEHRIIQRMATLGSGELSRNSHAVVAPYFTQVPGRHLHYVLSEDDVLPFAGATSDTYNESELNDRTLVHKISVKEGHFRFDFLTVSYDTFNPHLCDSGCRWWFTND